MRGKMRRTVLELELVTPSFLGGAEPQRTCEWRAASIRGQLRWWFRAVAGGHYRGDLEEVRKAEVRVFGDTSQASPLRVMALGEPETASAGKIPGHDPRLSAEGLATRWGMSPDDPDFEPTVERLRVLWNGRPVLSSPIQYLGYGCIGFKGLERPCILPDQRVRCRLQWRDRDWQALEGEISGLFATALWCWLHLGGIGAKSRKGFGSLACRGVEGELPGGGGNLVLAEPSLEELEEGVRRVLDGARGADGEPRWSHLSSTTRIFVATTPSSTWTDAMAGVGGWLIAYRRRYGYPDDARERNGRSLRDRDYVWASPAADGGAAFRQGFPDRAGFGLPLPFEKKDKHADRVFGETVNWQQGREESSKENRRASPLLIHIARLGQKKFFPVITHIPARFLPEGAVLTYKCGSKVSPPNAAQVGIVEHFCADLVAKKLLRQVMP